MRFVVQVKCSHLFARPNKIFANAKEDVAVASEEEVNGFNKFLERYKAAVPVEATAVKCVKGQHN